MLFWHCGLCDKRVQRRAYCTRFAQSQGPQTKMSGMRDLAMPLLTIFRTPLVRMLAYYGTAGEGSRGSMMRKGPQVLRSPAVHIRPQHHVKISRTPDHHCRPRKCSRCKCRYTTHNSISLHMRKLQHRAGEVCRNHLRTRSTLLREKTISLKAPPSQFDASKDAPCSAALDIATSARAKRHSTRGWHRRNAIHGIQHIDWKAHSTRSPVTGHSDDEVSVSSESTSSISSQSTERRISIRQDTWPTTGDQVKAGDLASRERVDPKVCDQCAKRFTRISDLKRHRRSHLPEKDRPYGCEKCDRRFLDAHTLERHALVHADKADWHTCIECGKRYNRRDNLTRHVLKEHADSTGRQSLAHPGLPAQYPATSSTTD